MRVGLGVLACVAALALASCDPGSPPADEQMQSMGIPDESALRVNEETEVTVRMENGSAEL